MIDRPQPDFPPLAPERVFALVVGIESYRVGTDWDLRGPARDAVRVAQWLSGPAGVPEANIRLFLSPLPVPPQGHLPEQPDTSALPAHRPATGADIEDALLRELPKHDGDLLFIYWAGHGYAGDQDQLLLPFADASTTPIRHLDLDSALRFWNSNKVHQAFRRIVSIGDACRLDPRTGTRSTFGRNDYGEGKPVRSRRTFTLYASRAGMPAQNIAGGGRLTEALLARLTGLTLDESIRSLPDIARLVHDDLATGGEVHQEVQWRITGWDGNPLLDTGWPEAPLGAPRLDEQAWAELRSLLAGPDLPPEAYNAYCWAFEAAGCVPPGPVLPAAEPMAVVRDLDQRLGSSTRRIPLPLAFVGYLAARQSDGEQAERLADWVRRTGVRLGTDAIPAPPAPEREGRAELHVRLTESTTEDAFLARMWLYRNGFETLWESGAPVSLAAVQQELVHQLFEAPAGPEVGRIEFHVPEILLDEEFEGWPLPTRGSRQGEIGCTYEVVVRCPEERTHQSGRRWLRKWAWYRKHGGRRSDAVLSLAGSTPIDSGLADRLGADGHPVCALLDRHTAPLHDRLEVLLDAGLPIALWRRTGRDGAHNPASACACNRAEDELAVVLAWLWTAEGTGSPDFDLGQLPSVVRKLRIGGGPCGCPVGLRLGLLWDDPEHRPQTGSLS
ncbi:hypothetical protein ACFY4B_17625 [Kitasatospora sp. NPDC001261]|uniref:VMAP-C domain-containing protein n=1 Tax=Kitasatospora sp. NPDC001261 TaxID=3364012 RepID=UPI0036CA4B73